MVALAAIAGTGDDEITNRRHVPGVRFKVQAGTVQCVQVARVVLDILAPRIERAADVLASDVYWHGC
jgi:hypothetical protein